jgi:ABC-type transport system involved in multi-copper enzyme maturation permease subunit
MLGQLAFHTFRRHLQTLRFALGVTIAVALMAAVALVQIQDIEARSRAAREVERRTVDYRNRITAWSMVRTELVLPPSNLAFMAKGLTNREPNRMEISVGTPATLMEMGYYSASNPLLDFLPDPDVVGIVALFFSLLAILFSYDMVSGARERGMLRMLLASGVGRVTLAAGMSLGGLLTLLFIVLLALGALLATIQWTSPLAITGAFLAALAVMAVEILVYTLVFFFIGLFCSCLCKRSNLSLLFALLVWVVLVLAWGPAAVQLVTQLDPLPTTEALEKYAAETDREFQGLIQAKASELVEDREYIFGWNTGNIFDWSLDNPHFILRTYKERPETSAVPLFRKLRAYGEPLREEYVGRIQARQLEYESRMWRQAENAGFAASLSPAVVLRRLAAVAAGTDPGTLRRFTDSARRLREAYIDFQRSKGYGSQDFTTDEHRNRAPLGLSGLPPDPKFGWDIQDVLARSAVDGALLILPLLLLVPAVGFLFNRYDVR